MARLLTPSEFLPDADILRRDAQAQQAFHNALAGQQMQGFGQGLLGGGQAATHNIFGDPLLAIGRGPLNGQCFVPEVPRGKGGIRDELQSEVDEWLKDIP